jgi:hypothetical protein
MICELEYISLTCESLMEKTSSNSVIGAINSMAMDFGWEFVSYAEGVYIFKRPR